MKTPLLALALALGGWATHASPSEENSPENPLVFDTKFVCDGHLQTGEKIQVTGRFVSGEMRGHYGSKGWQVDHIYVNGVRKPQDEQYNRNPTDAYFRSNDKLGRTYPDGSREVGASLFAYKTMNDGAFDHLVIEYLGPKNAGNFMALRNWDGANIPYEKRDTLVARGAKVACRFAYLNWN